MRDASLFVAARGRGWRDAERSLARAFDLSIETSAQAALSYFDTPDWRLRRSGMQLAADGEALLLRDAATAEVIAKGKWGAEAPHRFARDTAPPAFRDRLAAVTEPRVLLEVARARVVVTEALARDAKGRVAARIRSEASTVRGRGAARTLRVVFVSIPKGQKEAGAVVRRALTAAGFRPEHASAYDRVLARAGMRPGVDSARAAERVGAEASLRVAAVSIFRRLLRVMERNEAGVREGVDPEFLHDFRVALRRTRTALAEFKGVFTAGDARAFRARFAKLSAPSGRVRDVDVHAGRRAEYLVWIPEAFRAGLVPAMESLERERDARRADLLAVLDAREYATLKRDWKRALGALAAGRPAGVAADEPALPLARAAAARRYQRLRAIATAADTFDDAALHRARVQSKRLRYVLEFFAESLDDPVEDLIRAVERLQDALGAYHDATVLLSLFGEEVRTIPAGASDAVVRGVALGALMTSVEARRAKARARAVRRLAALMDRKSERAFEHVLAD